MYVTVQQLLEVQPTLQKLVTADLPALDAFRIARLIARLNPDIEAANAGRMKLFKKFGQRSGDGIQVPAESMDAFQAELRPLLESLCSVDVEPLPSSCLAHGPSMRPEEMVPLIPFIADPV